MTRPSFSEGADERTVFLERGLSGWLETRPAPTHAVTIPAGAPIPAPSPSVAALAAAPAGTVPITLLLSSMFTSCLRFLP